MYCSTDFCFICLNNNKDLNNSGTNHAELLYKLQYCFPEIVFSFKNFTPIICSVCSNELQGAYTFKEKFIKNRSVIEGYVLMLEQTKLIVHTKEQEENIKLELESENEDSIHDIPENLTTQNGFATIYMKEESYEEFETERNKKVKKENAKESTTKIKFDENKNTVTNSSFGNKIPLELKLSSKLNDQSNQSSIFDKRHFKEKSTTKTKFDRNKNTITNTSFENEPAPKVRLSNEHDSSNQASISSKNNLKNGGKTFWTCHYCHENFAEKSTYDNHMISHMGERKYECPICEKSFSLQGNLNKHMPIHTGERKYKCSICDKKFTQQGSLSNHMVTHTGERKYECSICYKKFTQKGSLKDHMVRHTGESKYECSICNKKFGKKAHLDSHMLVHTGQKNYVCNVCQKKFTLKGNLNKHMLSHVQVVNC